MENERTRLTKEILYNSLAQAIIRLGQTPFKLVKLFLALSVILSSGLAIIYIHGSFEAFFKYEVITTSRQILETPTLFPKITICNRNRFQTRKALDFLVEMNKIIDSKVNFFDAKQISLYNYSFKYDLATKISYMANGLIRNNMSDAQKQALGHSLKDILFNCKFDEQTCSYKDFSWTYDSYFGNCFEFNSGKLETFFKNNPIWSSG
jgi:hypothetical protein